MTPSKSILILMLALVVNHALLAAPSKRNTIASSQSLLFLENRGQIKDQNLNARSDIQFKLSAGNGLNIFICADAIRYQFSSYSTLPYLKHSKMISDRHNNSSDGHEQLHSCIMDRMDVILLGANKNAQIVTEQKQDYYETRYTPGIGNAGTTVHSYNKIIYKNAYPNIDWVLYIQGNGLKYEFIVRRGGRISDIRLKYCGASIVRLNSQGSLEATTPGGVITEDAPDIFQTDGKKINGRFKLEGDVLSYDLEAFSGDIIIDPGISWATYYGGSGDDGGAAVKTDQAGYVYMAGYTMSSSNIATSGAYHDTLAGDYDAYIVKFDSSGHRQWGTYYGGGGDEDTWDMTIDKQGNVYIAGETSSPTGIATTGACDTAFGYCSGGNCDGFLAKFDNSGALLWGTYYGGMGGDIATSVATDGMDNVFICGLTTSATGIATTAAYQPYYGGAEQNAFLAKFDSSGTRLWGTYYYGAPLDWVNGHSVATDAAGNVYMAGITGSHYGMATAGAYQTSTAGSDDAFIVKFSSTGVRLWGTYYGGPDVDLGATISIDLMNNIYLGGSTSSGSGIATAGAHQSIYGGAAWDGFLVKFDSTGSRQWATYYGGNGEDFVECVRVDDSASIYITGTTESSSHIASSDAYQSYLGGHDNAFVAIFNASGHRTWGTYYGIGFSRGLQIAIDSSRILYLTGITSSIAGIATSGAFQTTYGGGAADGFLAKFKNCLLPSIDTIAGTSTLCVGIATDLIDSSLGGVWSSANGVCSVSSAGAVIGLTTGIDTINYAITNSCGTVSVRHIVTVVAPTAGTITGLDSICVGATTTLSETLTGGYWATVIGNATISSTGLVTGAASGIDTVIYSVIGACSDTAIFPITVYRCDAFVNSVSGASQQFQVNPNPATGPFTLLFVSPSNEDVKITITNMLGQPVERMSLKPNHRSELRLDQPPGIYFVTAQCTSGTYIVKLAVQ